MDDKAICQHCGKPVGPEAIEGLCPGCLLKMGMGVGTQATSVGEKGQRAFVPPTVAELAAKLPQFEILGFIGQGGMGAVFKACQKQLDRVVALKILPPGLGENPAFAERFVREAKAMARLSHPGIVAIHDFGHAEGLYFLVMEFVDGVNLRQLIQTGRMAPREALAIVPQICDALQYAHDQGVVHRDIKPENILLDRRGRVKVADFGLAKLLSANGESGSAAPVGAGASGLTEAGKVMGTPQYMAPEQAEGDAEVDHRTDIYALGVVFYQMLTGELPGRQIELPSRKVQVDVRLDEVVLRALEREPARRYQQASQVKTAVETITRSSVVQPGSMAGTELRPRLRSRILMGAGLALVVLLTGGALGYRHWVSGRDQAARSGAELPVVATAVIKGDVGRYLGSFGTVESSNSVQFQITEDAVQEVVKKLDARQPLPIEAYDRDNKKRFGRGSVTGVDNKIDTTTATLKCRASLVPDDNHLMFPGMFLNIRVLLDMKTGVLLVPVGAVLHGPEGPFVMVIRPDHTVSVRPVQVLATDAGKAGIEGGVSPGDLVAIDGQYKLHDGSRVTARVVAGSPASFVGQPTRPPRKLPFPELLHPATP
jgi:serine/threonine protein kinase